MKPIHSIALLSLVLLASCASSKEKSTASAGPAHQPMSERWSSGGRDPNSFQRDGNGKLFLKNEKRSQYENQGESPYGKKDYKKQEYKTGDYAKKSWWGNKDYGRKEYAGNTDGSRFQKPSALDGMGAREAGNAADIPDAYQTGSYATGDSRESTNTLTREAKQTAHEASQRNGRFQWDEQRSLSVEQSKSMLGR